jgi:hypothetical protein
MRLSAGFIIAPLVALAACGQASGSALDPSNDLHCSVLAFYFAGFAQHSGAPADQQRGTAALHEWYASKARELVAQRSDPNAAHAEMGSVLEAIKRDPRSMLDEFSACTDRVAADPAFDAFARTLR